MLKRVLLLVLLAVVGWLVWRAFSPNNNPDMPVVEHPQTNIQLYFGKKTGITSQLVTVTRPLTTNQPRLNQAMVALLKGPTAVELKQGLYTELPKTLKLLKVSQTGKGYVVDVSEDIQFGGGSDAMTLRLAQITRTALAASPTTPVYLYSQGQPLTVLGGEGLEVPQPLKATQNPL
jgi:spore germination protein GerM